MKSLKQNLRIWHRKAALLAALPLLIIVLTGILLDTQQWIPGLHQPPVHSESSGAPELSFARVFEIAHGVPEADVNSWNDITQIDVRPKQGLLRVRSKNRFEIQIDGRSGKVLQASRRLTGLLIEIHEGSWFHPLVRRWVFLPAALLLLGLWVTGMWIYLGQNKNRR